MHGFRWWESRVGEFPGEDPTLLGALRIHTCIHFHVLVFPQIVHAMHVFCSRAALVRKKSAREQIMLRSLSSPSRHMIGICIECPFCTMAFFP